MKKPDKIYVHTGAHLGMLTLTTIPVGVTDEKEYIRKDALLEWAKEYFRLQECGSWYSKGAADAFSKLIDKLNSM